MNNRNNVTVIKLKITTLMALAIASVAIVAIGAAAPLNTIDLATKDGIGKYLVDQDGMTLYYFAEDAPESGTSSCSETCTHYWPPFHTGQVIIPLELSSFDFDTIYREDDTIQTTYKGWPLYYYINDYNPSDVRGQGINDAWFVAGPDQMP